MNFVHDGSQTTPDGQPMVYQPLGNLYNDQASQQDWQGDGNQAGQWRHIGCVTRKKERKYEASTEFNEVLHKARSYESKNAFKVLEVSRSPGGTKPQKAVLCAEIVGERDINAPKASENLKKKAAAPKASELDEEEVICIPCSPGGAGWKEKVEARNHKDPVEAKAKPNKATHVPSGKDLKAQRMPVHILTRVKEAPLNNFNDGKPQKWTRVSMAVDSGACDSVADPNQIPCTVKETQASRSGQNFASATGEPIPNLGEMVMPMRTREGTFRSMTVQAAPVTKPLASVLRIVQAGHTVVFDSAGSYILNKETQEVNMLREEDGNYMLDVWVKPTSDDDALPPFGRHP